MAKTEGEAQAEGKELPKGSSDKKRRFVMIGIFALVWVGIIIAVVWYLRTDAGVPGQKSSGDYRNAIPVSIMIPKWSMNVFPPDGKPQTMEVELEIQLGRTKEERDIGAVVKEEDMQNEKKAVETHKNNIIEMITVYLEKESYSNLTNAKSRNRIRDGIETAVTNYLNELFTENGMEKRVDKVIIKALRIR